MIRNKDYYIPYVCGIKMRQNITSPDGGFHLDIFPFKIYAVPLIHDDLYEMTINIFFINELVFSDSAYGDTIDELSFLEKKASRYLDEAASGLSFWSNRGINWELSII